MFNRKLSFMFGILVVGIALSFFIPPSHKAAAQQKGFNAIRLVNDTDESVCAVLMTYTDPYWVTRGWYCVNGNGGQYTLNNLTVNSDRVYFYATSASYIWSEDWNREFDQPENKGLPGVIDLANAFSYSFPEMDDWLLDIQSNIKAGFNDCATRVAQDCRSVALIRTTGQTSSDTVVLTFSNIKHKARQSVLEY